ncbi:hypothetical protein AUEXF2481DRAFT_25031 [Aureobasidium subglaciale EXF-2481]|uniref:Uncharacterized protein n=1 Tax=Aureobasidium subglaciale (strain EXF-2481) TaxID=1043005 RepID=A0A074ZR36_AURSE|nr:uncharacterized protein AUEXF2481DRAFT_25031 [Aureobasidium subglaciale EXF-2481]KAI5210261.1 hypothetical protein E4T38_02045 [Aureobasidium subglaciale]KAI5229020.1 hypothetical protein E4T40_01849 [Aureobasidium subglaciale]KAI5232804.1 hypothetical protein E4T41_02069 [Aureobasidium subglaciale]KAI5266029.1 hypothetical protein E4T46_01822 [Aureobasidium subglaciale]KER00742.1 hypothetical protein AUEXF2481DRAFT_25031 [Aureobasidium subglaciale EXF-2481]
MFARQIPSMMLRNSLRAKLPVFRPLSTFKPSPFTWSPRMSLLSASNGSSTTSRKQFRHTYGSCKETRVRKQTQQQMLEDIYRLRRLGGFHKRPSATTVQAIEDMCRVIDQTIEEMNRTNDRIIQKIEQLIDETNRLIAKLSAHSTEYDPITRVIRSFLLHIALLPWFMHMSMSIILVPLAIYLFGPENKYGPLEIVPAETLRTVPIETSQTTCDSGRVTEVGEEVFLFEDDATSN